GRSVGMMRAISDVIDHGTLGSKLGAHPVVQRIEFRFREEAAGDAGLIGEEEHEIPSVIQSADRLCRVRHPADALARAHIAVIVVDDAVAVEKGGGLSKQAVGSDADHVFAASAASLSTRCAVATTSEAGMSRMQRCSFMVQTGRWQGWHGTLVLVCTVA